MGNVQGPGRASGLWPSSGQQGSVEHWSWPSCLKKSSGKLAAEHTVLTCIHCCEGNLPPAPGQSPSPCSSQVSKAALQEKSFQDYNEKCTFHHQARVSRALLGWGGGRGPTVSPGVAASSGGGLRASPELLTLHRISL